MILPSKFVQEGDALLGIGARILKHLDKEMTLSELWDETKASENISNYERFILALDMLFIMELVVFENPIVRRVSK